MIRLPVRIIPPVVHLPDDQGAVTLPSSPVGIEPITDEDGVDITDEDGSPIFED